MRLKSGMAVAAVIVGFAVIPALGQKPIEEIITRVNNEIILRSEYEARIKQISQEAAQQGLQGVQLQQAIAERTRDALRDLIDERLMVQMAREMGLNADLDVIRYMDRVRQQNNLPSMEALEDAMRAQGINVDEEKQKTRNQILTQQVLQRDVYHKVQITTEELRAHYEANKKEFDKPQGVRLSEISIYTENKTPAEVEAQKKKAEEALAAVKSGTEFEEAVKKYSESQTVQSGGDLGFFEKGQLSDPLEQAASKLEKGQVSDLVQLPYGYLILKVTDKHGGGILPFELAQDDIQDLLWRQRISPKIREYLTKLRTDGFVKVNEGYVDTGAPPAGDAKPVKN